MGAGGGRNGSGTGGSNATGGSAGGTTGAADCSTLKLCDDFETAAPGKGTVPWKVTGTVEVVTDIHNSGMKALHISAPNTSNFSAYISETKTFPAADFWGRAYLRFKGDGGGHQMYIAVNYPGNQLRLLNRLGSDTPQVNFMTPDNFYAGDVNIKQETWFCYEWHVTTSVVNIYMDGKKLTTKLNGAVKDPPGITGGTSLLIGYNRFATGSGAGEMWIDDVAVNDTQIGCL